MYNDPYTLRSTVHELAGSQLVATGERDLPIPVDVYQLDNSSAAKDKPDVVEAVKGRGYREVALKSSRRKGRQK